MVVFLVYNNMRHFSTFEHIAIKKYAEPCAETIFEVASNVDFFIAF